MGLAGTPIDPPRGFEPGPRNLITDVAGIRVGHVTLSNGGVQTGVTALLPPGSRIFERKLHAAAQVFNGYGKSAGLVQVDELGLMESPVALCGTLSVGTCWQALCRRLASDNPGLTSVNPLVFECNDGTLNDIRGFHLTEADVWQALDSAAADFVEGAVGAGRGMVCHGLSGGIGSASRMIDIDGWQFTMGVLALTNHGLLRDLAINGNPLGRGLADGGEAKQVDTGSVIMIIATDVPLTHLKLRRICRRAVIGLARTGAYMGHGSGEIAFAFSTHGGVRHQDGAAFRSHKELTDAHMDTMFRAATECVEESVLSSLWHAEAVTGYRGRRVPSLRELIDIF